METCQICNREYKTIWTAPDELWKKVNINDGGTICPECFDDLYFDLFGERLYWECKEKEYPTYRKEERWEKAKMKEAVVKEKIKTSAVEKKTRIIVNKIRCKKCEDIIESVHRHDFRFCKCGAVFVDGGKDYLRRGGKLTAYEDLSEVEEIKEDSFLKGIMERCDD